LRLAAEFTAKPFQNLIAFDLRKQEADEFYEGLQKDIPKQKSE
jgi:hypothetical protein